MKNDVVYSQVSRTFTIEYKNAPHTSPMPPHTHNGAEVFFNLSYLPSVLLDSKVIPAEKNTLILFPSYCVHKLSSLPGEAYERYVLTADTFWLERVLGAAGNIEYLKASRKPFIIALNDTEVKRLIDVFEDFLSAENSGAFIRLARFFDVMTVIDGIYSDSRKNGGYLPPDKISSANRTVNEIIEYINEHLFESLMIKDIAAHFYLNPDYVSRIFKKHTNTHINNYITMQRIAAARRLLISGESINDVWEKTGYLSYSHFFRVFKKETGMTPREFKDLVEKSEK